MDQQRELLLEFAPQLRARVFAAMSCLAHIGMAGIGGVGGVVDAEAAVVLRAAQGANVGGGGADGEFEVSTGLSSGAGVAVLANVVFTAGDDQPLYRHALVRRIVESGFRYLSGREVVMHRGKDQAPQGLVVRHRTGGVRRHRMRLACAVG